ncbi:MAG: ECF transporter S component [Erysipelotrichaceae bacterium]|nr:ECF transporter S component [Erysipelotrichaceae bacterium]
MTRNRQRLMMITSLGLLMAMIIIMTYIPNLGYITTGFFSITIVHIPVIIGAILTGPIGGLVLGVTWGVTSWHYATTLGTIEAAIFVNPLVSILPRILVGLIISYSSLGLKKIIRFDFARNLVVSILGALSNTVLVLTAIFLFASSGLVTFNQGLSYIFTFVISLNGSLEILSAGLLAPTVLKALSKASLVKK